MTTTTSRRPCSRARASSAVRGAEKPVRLGVPRCRRRTRAGRPRDSGAPAHRSPPGPAAGWHPQHRQCRAQVGQPVLGDLLRLHHDPGQADVAEQPQSNRYRTPPGLPVRQGLSPSDSMTPGDSSRRSCRSPMKGRRSHGPGCAWAAAVRCARDGQATRFAVTQRVAVCCVLVGPSGRGDGR
jgi:hypothetical protein